jgi:hypothetical protein
MRCALVVVAAVVACGAPRPAATPVAPPQVAAIDAAAAEDPAALFALMRADLDAVHSEDDCAHYNALSRMFVPRLRALGRISKDVARDSDGIAMLLASAAGDCQAHRKPVADIDAALDALGALAGAAAPAPVGPP